MSDALDGLAARVDSDPAFLGHHIRRWALARGITWDGVCAWLGVDADGLTRLRLCRAPRHPADCEAIAARFGCDVGRLCGVMGG